MSHDQPLSGPVLVLDAASPQTWVGLLNPAAGGSQAWYSSVEESGIALFKLATEALGEAGLEVGDVRTFVFCDGPGSMLGIRLAAVALRTWMATRGAEAPSIWSYRSLDLLASALLADGETPPFSVICDARRKSWNVLRVGPDGVFSEIERNSSDLLEAIDPGREKIFTPASFPRWQPFPSETLPRDYRPDRLAELAGAGRPLLRMCEQPDAWFSDAPTYKEWDPSLRPAPPPTPPSRQ